MLLLSVDASTSEFFKSNSIKKGHFQKYSYLSFKMRRRLNFFSVLSIRLFHITGPLMEIGNLYLRILICGFL